MPWNNPLPTFTDGVAPTAAQLNDILENLEWLHAPPSDSFEYSGADLTTTSTTFASISSDFELAVTTTGGHVFCLLVAHARFLYFDIEIDGARLGGTNGIAVVSTTSFGAQVQIPHMIFNLAAGAHTFKAMWKRETSGTPGIIYADVMPRFYVREL